jgi:small subunit ribosomal protein S16
MVKLRLTRTGKTHSPTYRLIAIQARTKRDGRAIEFLGFYDPKASPSVFEYDKERVKYWLSVGAQPSETVRDFLAKDKLVKAKAKNFKKKPGRKASEKAEAAKAAAEKSE